MCKNNNKSETFKFSQNVDSILDFKNDYKELVQNLNVLLKNIRKIKNECGSFEEEKNKIFSLKFIQRNISLNELKNIYYEIKEFKVKLKDLKNSLKNFKSENKILQTQVSEILSIIELIYFESDKVLLSIKKIMNS